MELIVENKMKVKTLNSSITYTSSKVAVQWLKYSLVQLSNFGRSCCDMLINVAFR